MGQPAYNGVIAIHLGAGFIDKKTKKETLNAAKRTLQLSAKIDQSIDAVVTCSSTVELLENEPVTNAGIGSNLSKLESVECDASIMGSELMSFGAVGAVENIQNPIHVARNLLKDQENTKSPLTLPMLLVGKGAYEYGKSIGAKTISTNDMITKRSLEDYRSALGAIMRQKETETDMVDYHGRMDTVGCVVIDNTGHSSAGCSSGGILLKTPGRVGSAGIYGAGCWAEESELYSLAASVSGCGEMIMKTGLARTVCQDVLYSHPETDVVLGETVERSFRKRFLEETKLLGNTNSSHKMAGILIVRLCKTSGVREVVWVHNTPSMCVGFVSAKSPPKVYISELGPKNTAAVHGHIVN